MPTKRGTMSPHETRFVKAYVDSGDAQSAAEKAGYAQPRSQGYQALARPAIQAEVVRQQTERLTNTLLPLAVGALERLLTNERTPAGAVVAAAKLVMDRTLGSQDGSEKQPHEMTADELSRALDHLRREAAERATVVIDQPVPGVFA